jgi:addiction module RelE/StbE family toxin
MWQVFESRAAKKALDKAPKDVQAKWTVWLTIVRHGGPDGLRSIPGFHDEALSGEWRGYRSSRLSLRYRVIYVVRREEIEVQVISVTSHDYRRK